MTALDAQRADYPPIQNGKEKRGGLLLPADKVKLDAATSAATPNTLVRRDASGVIAVVAITGTTGWVALSFAANWSNHGESPGQYRVNVLGEIEVMGLVKKAIALVANDIIATLPAGARPATNRRYAQTSAAGFTEIVVNTAGQIFIAAGGSATYTSLAGLVFDPAQ